jgi:hypothetical protein
MKLFIYGLSDEELAAVRARVPDAAVERLTALPDRAPEELLIVGAAAFGEFVQWAERRTQEDGIQPRPVLLYGGQVDNLPDEGWEYYDGVVSDEDWERLDALLECPHVLDAELAAADVRAHFLRDLKRPVTELRVGEILFGDSEWNRPESEMRQHLATCVTCRAAFNEALEWRMNLRGQLLEWPAPKMVVQVAGEQAVQERPVWQEWLAAKMVVKMAGEQAVQERRRQTALAALLTALLAAQLRARTIQLMGERGAVTVDDIPDLLAQLQEGATFVRPHRELKLQLSDGQLMFDSLRGEYAEEVRNFRLELRRGEETLWGANSVEGKVSLPLTELEQALAAGADQLLILTPPEEG